MRLACISTSSCVRRSVACRDAGDRGAPIQPAAPCGTVRPRPGEIVSAPDGLAELAPGKAYWVQPSAHSRFVGPLEVRTANLQGLFFDASLHELPMHLKNASVAPLSLTLQHVDSDPPPQSPVTRRRFPRKASSNSAGLSSQRCDFCFLSGMYVRIPTAAHSASSLLSWYPLSATNSATDVSDPLAATFSSAACTG